MLGAEEPRVTEHCRGGFPSRRAISSEMKLNSVGDGSCYNGETSSEKLLQITRTPTPLRRSAFFHAAIVLRVSLNTIQLYPTSMPTPTSLEIAHFIFVVTKFCNLTLMRKVSVSVLKHAPISG